MNVQEFVSESLRQISLGVQEGRKEKGIPVSPRVFHEKRLNRLKETV
jgi:hypothetical protein